MKRLLLVLMLCFAFALPAMACEQCTLGGDTAIQAAIEWPDLHRPDGDGLTTEGPRQVTAMPQAIMSASRVSVTLKVTPLWRTAYSDGLTADYLDGGVLAIQVSFIG